MVRLYPFFRAANLRLYAVDSMLSCEKEKYCIKALIFNEMATFIKASTPFAPYFPYPCPGSLYGSNTTHPGFAGPIFKSDGGSSAQKTSNENSNILLGSGKVETFY